MGVHYSLLIKTPYATAPVEDTTTSSVAVADTPVTDMPVEDNLPVIKNVDEAEPEQPRETVLMDEEVSKLIDVTKAYKDAYFDDMCLSRDVPSIFLHNVPKEIFEISEDLRLHEEPDIVDPLLWFTVLCVNNPKLALVRLLRYVIDETSEDAYLRIREMIIDETTSVSNESDETTEEEELQDDVEIEEEEEDTGDSSPFESDDENDEDDDYELEFDDVDEEDIDDDNKED